MLADAAMGVRQTFGIADRFFAEFRHEPSRNTNLGNKKAAPSRKRLQDRISF
jgi:hypothetical protein